MSTEKTGSAVNEAKPRPASDPGEWVEQHADALFGYAMMRVGDPEVARDLVQEVFLAAVQASESFAGRSSARTWLTGILKHKIADHFRKKAREATDPVEDPAEQPFQPDGRWRTAPEPWKVDPSHAVGRKEFWEALHRCLRDLPARQAAAFALRELEGQDTAQLCKVLDTTPTNVWVLLHRARTGLRGCLERGGFGPEGEEKP
ncbi:MAG: hypothetical protein Kow0092_12500 [Deferrisomatales bacterium]